MRSMKTSIIIPNRDNFEFLNLCLRSIERHTKDCEIIIVDNSSDKRKADPFYYKFPYNLKARVIRNYENRSYAESNNQGVKLAEGEFLCLLNNDTIVTEGWVENALKVFKEENNVGVVGVKILQPGIGHIHHAGVKTYLNGLTDHKYFGKQSSYKEANRRCECFAVTGACMFVSRELYNSLNGLHEEYWYGWEDIDFCNKVRKESGMRIFYEPTSVIYHYESRTPGRYSGENQNMNLYMKRWIFSGAYTRKELELWTK
jgi:GT2 family glycosyltransferase